MRLSCPLAAAFAAVLSLAACGGGGGDAGTTPTPPAATGPTALKTTDTVVGTGVVAANGDRVQVNYAGWLYDAAIADNKGTRFDASQAGKPLRTARPAGLCAPPIL